MDTMTAIRVEACLTRLRDGDASARDELLDLTSERLERLARRLRAGFPGVGRWEQTEDVAQIAMFKIYEMLDSVVINDPQHFYRLAARKIRETLIDLARHYLGPQGMGANHATAIPARPEATDAGRQELHAPELTQDPQRLARWCELHQAIEQLPDPSRQMFDLLWYHELGQEEAAELLEISVRQVKRRWRTAKLELAERLGDASGIFN